MLARTRGHDERDDGPGSAWPTLIVVMLLMGGPTVAHAAGVMQSAPPALHSVPCHLDAITLSQTTSNSIVAGNSISCSETATGYTAENSYYRRFVMADYGITTAFTVSQVGFGVELANSATGTQPISIRLYSIPTGSPMELAGLTLINQVNLSLSNQSLANVLASVSAALASPTTSDLVAEVFVPDGRASGHSFLMGSNPDAETRPSYIRAPDCGFPDIMSFASIGYSNVHILLTVTGTTGSTGAPIGLPGAMALELKPPSPNPTRAGTFSVSFALPNVSPADLELIDITGRRLGDWEVGSLGTGSHTMEVGRQRLMPGIYLVRLTQAGQSLTSRVAVIE